ncbi:unnamed protein product [Amoebophrya sp. A120]|nr:unnamed protein product [Amoebophrya sp. A120]|eukprot:GSA120T00002629001.1
MFRAGRAGLRMAKQPQVLIDVHTHMYYPAYMEVLRQRTAIPKVVRNAKNEERLVILPNEEMNASDTTNIGRPIGAEYFDVREKLQFMDAHGISHSIVSLANPWLDFLTSDAERAAAPETARKLNEDLNTMCAGAAADSRLFGFAVLPTTAGGAACAREVEACFRAPEPHNSHLKGVILGTSGVLGQGLDGKEMEPVYAALEQQDAVLFIHPHYGLAGEDLSRYGHSLELALGFPMETSIAISRLILSGVLDRYPNLKVYVAHAGGVLPYLQGRLDSCVGYEKQIVLQKKPSDYLRDLYYDAIIYNPDCLKLLVDTVGADRIMYGTDHPFFPPTEGEQKWKSALKIQEIVPEEHRETIFGNTATRLFGLESEVAKALSHGITSASGKNGNSASEKTRGTFEQGQSAGESGFAQMKM